MTEKWGDGMHAMYHQWCKDTDFMEPTEFSEHLRKFAKDKSNILEAQNALARAVETQLEWEKFEVPVRISQEELANLAFMKMLSEKKKKDGIPKRKMKKYETDYFA